MKSIYKRTSLLLMIFITASLFANSKATISNENSSLTKTKYKYFYHLPFRESPYRQFNGIYPTTKKKAEKRNHYRLAYDKSGRLTELALMRNGRLIVNTTSNNFFMGVARITFSYEGNKEKLQFYNFKDVRTEFNNVWEAVYTKDNNGNRIRLEYFDREGKPVENNWRITKYTWEIDTEGRVKEQRFNLKGEQAMIRSRFDFYEVRLTFDKRGYLTTMENYGLEGKLTNNRTGVAMDKLVYDKHGNFIQWKVYNKEGKALLGNLPGSAGGNHEYNEFGDQIKTEVFDLEGKLMIANWRYAYVQRTYNKYGDMVSDSYHGTDGEMLVRGGARGNTYFAKAKHNEIGQVIELTFCDKEGNPANEARLQISTSKFIYDENYDLIERRHYTKDGKLAINRGRGRGYAVEKYIYKDGEISERLRYDADMKLIKQE